MSEQFRGSKIQKYEHNRNRIYLENEEPYFKGTKVYKSGVPRTTIIWFRAPHMAALETYIKEMIKEVKGHPELYYEARLDFNKQGLNPDLLPRPKKK